MKANIFFDFETTYLADDLLRVKKLVNKDNAFDQVSFCVSYMRDIDFDIKEYVRLVRNISNDLY